MSLGARLVVDRGEWNLDAEVVAAPGEVTAVLGPNGAGKTTMLDALCGALPLDGGCISLGEVVLDEPPSVWVPPERRRIGMVHQDYLLFPHLSVRDNVAFGPRSRGTGRRDARDVADDWLERVGLSELAGSRPSELSGGQAQRVALARALATEPALLLLDEPLAALDARSRVQVRRDLRRHLAAFAGPTVLVTHDPLDVLALATTVIVLENGRVTQAGSVAEVTSRPRSLHVAEMIGTNLLHGDARGSVVTLVREGGAGPAGADTSGADSVSVTTAETHEGSVFVVIEPSAVALHVREPEGSPRNRWPTTVEHIDVMGDRVRVQLGEPVPVVAEVTPASVAELGLTEHGPVWASVKATEVLAYPV